MASQNYGFLGPSIRYPLGMSVGTRIKQAREARGLTQLALAKLIRVSRAAVTQWESGINEPTRANLKKLAKALQVSEQWLLEGVEQTGEQALMPVRGEVAAGLWKEADADLALEPIPLARHPDFPATSQYALLVRGDSLNRIAADGDFLHVVDVAAAGIIPQPGDLVIALKHRHGMTEATAKRLVEKDGEFQLVAESYNPKFAGVVPLEPTDDETEIVITAKVIGKYTSLYRPKA